MYALWTKISMQVVLWFVWRVVACSRSLGKKYLLLLLLGLWMLLNQIGAEVWLSLWLCCCAAVISLLVSVIVLLGLVLA